MNLGELERESSGNSSLDKHSADLGFFGVSQTQSLVSTPKIPKSNESHTKNPSVVLNVKCAESSLRGESQICAKQSKNSPSLAEGEEIVESHTAHDSQNKQSKDLRCGFAPFPRETSEIELGVHRAQFYAETAQIAYPKANCAQDNAQESTKCGFIALIGRPNAGKSTLLNALINENLALTSHKVNATRKQSNIIVMHENAQMIFIDTPGLHKSQKMLNTLMVEESLKAIKNCDIVAFLACVNDEIKHYEEFLKLMECESQGNKAKKHILLLSKIDLTSKVNLLKTLKSYQKYSDKFEAIIPISALKRVNLEQILGAIAPNLPNSPFLYDSEIITPTHLREIYREKIRESLFNFTNKEVPYTSEVRILRIIERANLTKIYAEIITEKTSQKKIIIGQGGKSIKNIGIDARKKIELFSGGKVFLSLNVVCEKGWSKDKKAIEKIIN